LTAVGEHALNDHVLNRTVQNGILGMTLLAAAGCHGSGLDLALVKSTSGKPSNVAVYFRVDQSDGTPVGGLTEKNFRIYEDNGLVSEFESKQTILNPRVAASLYTLLLVDMSGSVSKSGHLDSVVEAASAFTEKVEKYQKVGVYAFDGSPDLHPIVPFTSSGGAAKGGVRSLAGFQPRDPSTNLHGAIMKGLELLKAELSHAEQPLRFGTLVVFTDGTDRAGRASKDDMLKAIRQSEYDTFAIGLGAEISEGDLKEIGKNGTAMAKDREAVVQAFDQIASKIEGFTRRYYLLSYCTPARAGEHEVRLEASVKSEDGKQERSGSLRYRFKADKFTPECDPASPPSFDVTRGDALLPKEPKEAPPTAKSNPPPVAKSSPRHAAAAKPTPAPASAPPAPSTSETPPASAPAAPRSEDYNP
jgi:hypothetical protein